MLELHEQAKQASQMHQQGRDWSICWAPSTTWPMP